MRLNAAAAVFVAFAMVAVAIGIVASNALMPGFARLSGDQTQTSASSAGTMQARLPRSN